MEPSSTAQDAAGRGDRGVSPGPTFRSNVADMISGGGGGEHDEHDDCDVDSRGISNHVVVCGGAVIAGPCRTRGASGHVNFVVIGTMTFLFVSCFNYIVEGFWVQVAPVLYLGCWVVLYFAAYTDPGVLPRRWQIRQNPTPEALKLLEPREVRASPPPLPRTLLVSCRPAACFPPLDASGCPFTGRACR